METQQLLSSATAMLPVKARPGEVVELPKSVVH